MTNAHKREADDYLDRQTIAQPDRRFTADLPPAAPLTLQVRRLTPNATLPTRAHASDSGYDVYAAEDVLVLPGGSVTVATGIAVKLPPGHEGQLRPRSGITSRTPLRVQLGTIDNGYTGELAVICDNIAHKVEGVTEDGMYTEVSPLVSTLGGGLVRSINEHPVGTVVIQAGDKLAQLVVQPLPAVTLTEVDTLTDADRGAKGFGSTGVR